MLVIAIMLLKLGNCIKISKKCSIELLVHGNINIPYFAEVKIRVHFNKLSLKYMHKY